MAKLNLCGVASTEVQRLAKVERTKQDFINLVFYNSYGDPVRITVFDGVNITIPKGKDIILEKE